jgi:hypothetical protein
LGVVFPKFSKISFFFGFVGDFSEKQRLHRTMTLAKEDLTALAEAIKDLSPATNAVAIKLPTFWTEDPDVWFTQVESQFAIRNITTDQTKYHYVVAALNTSMAAEVRASLLAPPDDNKYQALKTALLAAYSRSQAQKDSELLAMSGLGDKTPMAFLRRLRGLNSDPAAIFRAFFLAQLPAEVRGVLAAQNLADLDDLAKAADRIIVARQAGSGPSAFSVAADNPGTYDQAPGVSAVSGRSGGSGGRRPPQQPRPNGSSSTPATTTPGSALGLNGVSPAVYLPKSLARLLLTRRQETLEPAARCRIGRRISQEHSLPLGPPHRPFLPGRHRRRCVCIPRIR